MPEEPSSTVNVAREGEVATVVVCGALDHTTGPRIRDLLDAAPGDSSLSRLVLDLTGVSDRLGAESLALIAVIKFGLPPGCALEVRTPTQAVHDVMGIAETARHAGACQGPPHEGCCQDDAQRPSDDVAV